MTSLDVTVAQTLTEAELDLEMETLIANRPEYREAVPGTESAIEPGKARAITSTAAELTIYNRETGEPSQVIFDALKARMMQRFPETHPNPKFAGTRVYTTRKTDAPTPLRGTYACPLRYDNPSPDALALGFGTGSRVCSKPAIFLSEYDVEEHVRKNHKRFYEQRESKRERDEREADRDLQRQMLAAMQQQQQPRIRSIPATMTTTNAPSDTTNTPHVSDIAVDVADLVCECGWAKGKNEASLKLHKRLHCPMREGA